MTRPFGRTVHIICDPGRPLSWNHFFKRWMRQKISGQRGSMYHARPGSGWKRLNGGIAAHYTPGGKAWGKEALFPPAPMPVDVYFRDAALASLNPLNSDVAFKAGHADELPSSRVISRNSSTSCAAPRRSQSASHASF
jgi:hypothetical protein